MRVAKGFTDVYLQRVSSSSFSTSFNQSEKASLLVSKATFPNRKSRAQETIMENGAEQNATAIHAVPSFPEHPFSVASFSLKQVIPNVLKKLESGI